jgi:16S rRNA (guanine966-N2)-methyltransferase
MRVISGSARGRTLHAPPAGTETRPTTDKVREALFNVLGPVEGLSVLDLFAGTGALGIEALSRGAARCVFVEASDRLCATIARNLQDCRFSPQGRVVARDVRRTLGKPAASLEGPFDLALIDPPYAHGLEVLAIERLVADGWLAEGAAVVVERATRDVIAWPEAALRAFAEPPYEREYGDTTLVFFFGFGVRSET